MSDIRVVLVGPKFEGNVGAVARAMANFDVQELYLVSPCEIGDDARRRAKHGNDILDNAVIVDTLDEALKDCFLVCGTSGIVTKGDSNFVRVPISPRALAERANEYTEKIALVFGREDLGLYQDELSKCDVLVHIPSSDTYPVLNLSHAVTIVLYEMFGCKLQRPNPANLEEKEQMFEFFDNILDAINYPEHRKESTSVMFRRLIGRSVPTKWEYNTILGVFKDAARLAEKNKKD